jgi:hypothetical protein
VKGTAEDCSPLRLHLDGASDRRGASERRELDAMPFDQAERARQLQLRPDPPP